MIIIYSILISTAFWATFYRIPVGSASGIFLGITGLLTLAGLHEPMTRQYVLDGAGLLVLGTILLAVVDILKYLVPKADRKQV